MTKMVKSSNVCVIFELLKVLFNRLGGWSLERRTSE